MKNLTLLNTRGDDTVTDISYWSFHATLHIILTFWGSFEGLQPRESCLSSICVWAEQFSFMQVGMYSFCFVALYLNNWFLLILSSLQDMNMCLYPLSTSVWVISMNVKFRVCVNFIEFVSHRILYLNSLLFEPSFGMSCVFIGDLNQTRLAANFLYFESKSLVMLFWYLADWLYSSNTNLLIKNVPLIIWAKVSIVFNFKKLKNSGFNSIPYFNMGRFLNVCYNVWVHLL